jgi:spore coat protein U-like protein
MQCNRLLGLGCFLLALAGAPSSDKALSATATTTFQVVANVLVACTINATDMNFGDYTAFKLNTQSQISVICTNTAQWNVGLSPGRLPGPPSTTGG